MPVVAVAGAFAGASALAAGGLTVLQTIAAIGGIVSGIGAVTGNETLMKIGGVAALAGGIGAFAQGKGWLSASDAAAGAESVSNTQALMNTPAPGLETVAQNNPSAYVGQAEVATSGLPQTGGLDAGSIASNITQTDGVASQVAGNAEQAGLIDAANPTDLRLAEGTQTSPLESMQGSVNPDINAKDSLFARGAVQSPLSKEGNILGKLTDFWKGMDKESKSMLSNFVGGAFDKKKGAEADYLEARADEARQRLANGSAIPNMNFSLKKKNLFKPTAPTYNAPRPAGLFYAKG